MLREVRNVEYVDKYQLHLTFDNNEDGIVDISKYIWGEVFEPLKDVLYFKRVKVDKELGTITWPNGADIAPETLYDEIKKRQ